MKHLRMFVRVSDDCSVIDCSFSLTGSTKAINYVYGNYAKYVADELEIYERKRNIQSGLAMISIGYDNGSRRLMSKKDYFSSDVGGIVEKDTVMILNVSNDWVQIITKDSIVGWCSKEFVFPIL